METERVGRGLIRPLGDLMEEELEAATDLQLIENISQMALDGLIASVVRPMLLYINSGAVIPAKLVPACFKRGAGIQLKKTGFRVKPGMTIKVKGLSTHYTSLRSAHSSPTWVLRMALTRSWCVAPFTRRPRKAAAHAG